MKVEITKYYRGSRIPLIKQKERIWISITRPIYKGLQLPPQDISCDNISELRQISDAILEYLKKNEDKKQ